MTLPEQITGAMGTLTFLEDKYAVLQGAEERLSACDQILQGTRRTIAECAGAVVGDKRYGELQVALFLEQGLEDNREMYAETVERLRERVTDDVQTLLGIIDELLQSDDARLVDPSEHDVRQSVLMLQALYERPIRDTVAFVRRTLDVYRLMLA